ncbi:UDP-glucose 4-epimerase GalE [Planococcus lenghuensis]|uniref:UDP-glucose 4-epimerase n=1 Tax=Planococcus lenghuensis TaxID=2213202 RepID=A0A1Q2L2E6_9BACL|nr:UDP-glucose 4-epimerase GalE [Planococcus lenghuensis]AQQ54227.1 UDP-glucose 4-epimerase GalE [Planococcus lenghuensis]
MKVLVTGGLGYIGSHTVTELCRNGIDSVVLDCVNDWQEKLVKLERACDAPVRYVHCNLLDIYSLRSVFRQYQFDAVIHFAGLKAVGESVKEPLKYYEHNLGMTINLLKVMDEMNVKKLIFSSSATVYGNNSKPPIRETEPTSVLNPYGRTKLMIEEMLEDLYGADSTWRIGVLRYFNPVGAHESGLIGENPQGTPNNLMPFLTQVASGERSELSIFGGDYETKDGTGVRDFIHIMDLADGHVKMLSYLTNHAGKHTFNLGTGKGYSVLDMVTIFEQVNNVRVPYKVTSRRPGDTAVCYADPSKAEKVLNWKAIRGIREMCIDAWRWEKEMKRQKTFFLERLPDFVRSE